jgi:hypothetical protein
MTLSSLLDKRKKWQTYAIHWWICMAIFIILQLSVTEKKCGLGFQKGVNHTCRGAGSLSPLQTTFSQLLFMFIKLGFEIFEL